MFYSNRPVAFLLNRALRIFPPFLVALLFSLADHVLLVCAVELKFFDPVVSQEEYFGLSNIAANTLSLVVLIGAEKLGLVQVYPFVRYSWAIAIE